METGGSQRLGVIHFIRICLCLVELQISCKLFLRSMIFMLPHFFTLSRLFFLSHVACRTSEHSVQWEVFHRQTEDFCRYRPEPQGSVWSMNARNYRAQPRPDFSDVNYAVMIYLQGCLWSFKMCKARWKLSSEWNYTTLLLNHRLVPLLRSPLLWVVSVGHV